MPSFQDSAVIFFIALLLFGPKKLPELARYVGKLMNEFRRASNEFRMQMQDEFRQVEQAEQQKKIAAMEAAAPLAPGITADIPDPEHPHLQIETAEEPLAQPALESSTEVQPDPVDELTPEPVPIASSGDLHLMPPATGLPVSRSNSQPNTLSDIFDSVPHAAESATHESETHG